MKRAEDSLQIAIVNLLRAHGLFVAHAQNGGFARSPQQGKRFKDMGVVAGYPDLIVHAPGGVTVLIEVKAPPKRLKSGALSKAKATLSEAQQALHPQLAAMGIPVLVARDAQSVLSALRNMGVLPQQGRGK